MRFEARHVVTAGGCGDEVAGQKHNVFTPRAQRRYTQFHDIETVVRIGTKAFLSHQLKPLDIADRKDADIRGSTVNFVTI